MGVRTRGLDIKAGAAKLKVDRAALLEAELVIDSLESTPGHRPRHAVVTHDPGGATRWSAMARRFLSGLRDEPSDRPSDARPSPAGLGRHYGARLAMRVVPGIGAMPMLLGLYALPPANRAR
jgi:hypothetical protein